jgi:hypothetical protein
VFHLGQIHPLYRFNEWWVFFFLMLYIVFLQYTFMNIFTSTLFEEHRFHSRCEEALQTKRYEKVRKRAVFRLWCLSLCIPCRRKPVGVSENGEKIGADANMGGVNELRDRMRANRVKKKRGERYKIQ